MSYKTVKTIGIPEDTKKMLDAIKGKDVTYQESIEALIEIEELVRKILGIQRRNSLKVLKKFREKLEEEEMI